MSVLHNQIRDGFVGLPHSRILLDWDGYGPVPSIQLIGGSIILISHHDIYIVDSVVRQHTSLVDEKHIVVVDLLEFSFGCLNTHPNLIDEWLSLNHSNWFLLVILFVFSFFLLGFTAIILGSIS